MNALPQTSQGPKSDTLLIGKVAQVLNDRELVINLGRDAGVRKGMQFRVMAEANLEIIDPDSREPIGNLDREKVHVEVIEVYPKMAVCRTYEYQTVGGEFSGLATISEMLGPARKIYETFDIEDSSLPKPLPLEQSYVKIGDIVKQLRDK